MKLPADKVNQLRMFYEGRGVCVTGGAGFIGGHLCDALLSLGASITVLDDLSNSTTEHLSGLIELEPERVRFVHGSILDDDALAAAICDGAGARYDGDQPKAPCKTIFHLAALGSVPRSVEEPQRTWSVNATGTLRVLEAARGHGKGGVNSTTRSSQVERVIAASSSSIYGNQPELPKVETQVPRPLSPYAASKQAGEHLLASYAACYGLSTVSLRFFNVFGPRQSAESAYAAVIPAFTKRLMDGEPPVIYGDGEQTRDFTYVGNAVLAMLAAGAMGTTKLTGQAVNIGSGKRTSLVQLAQMIAKLCDVPSVRPVFQPARNGDVKHSYADVSAAKQLLGFEPVTSPEEGLTETVEWYRRAMAGR